MAYGCSRHRDRGSAVCPVTVYQRTPAELTALVDKIEAVVRDNVRSLRTSLVDQTDLREVFQTMLPDGLTFRPARVADGKRQIWEIEGDATRPSTAWVTIGFVRITTRVAPNSPPTAPRTATS
jgi:hypothetical protein